MLGREFSSWESTVSGNADQKSCFYIILVSYSIFVCFKLSGKHSTYLEWVLFYTPVLLLIWMSLV